MAKKTGAYKTRLRESQDAAAAVHVRCKSAAILGTVHVPYVESHVIINILDELRLFLITLQNRFEFLFLTLACAQHCVCTTLDAFTAPQVVN